MFGYLIGNAQSENDTMDLANYNVNAELLEKMFYKKLNSYRKEKGIPEYITADPVSLMAAEYNNSHFLIYNRMRSEHIHLNSEPVNGLNLYTRQDRLNYFSNISGYSEREIVTEYSDGCDLCNQRITYNDYVDDFAKWIQEDLDSEIGNNSKYIAVKFSLRINPDNFFKGLPRFITTVILTKDGYNVN